MNRSRRSRRGTGRREDGRWQRPEWSEASPRSVRMAGNWSGRRMLQSSQGFLYDSSDGRGELSFVWFKAYSQH